MSETPGYSGGTFFGHVIMSCAQALLVAWAVTIAFCDARWRRVPNLLSLGATIMALCFAMLAGTAPSGVSIASGVIAAALALLLLVPAYAVHWVGAGDVKLGAAMGLLGGIKLMLVTLAIGGLLLALLAVHATRIPRDTSRPRVLPYGTAHGIGFAIAVIAADLFPGGMY